MYCKKHELGITHSGSTIILSNSVIRSRSRQSRDCRRLVIVESLIRRYFIDWTLQRPTPAPGNKLMQLLSDNNLTQHEIEAIKQNKILYLVLYTEDELIVNLKITYKIGDHRAIIFSIKAADGNIAL